MKICNVCKEAKTDYSRRTASKDGLSYTCRDCERARAKANYLGKEDIYIARANAWKKQNPDKRRHIVAKSSKLHRAQKTAYAREWRRNNPERFSASNRLNQAKRRALAIDSGLLPNSEWWGALIGLFETGACLYCGVDGRKLVMDHFVPIKLGGKTEMGNILPCCASCNSRKHATHPGIWVTENCTPGSYERISEFLRLTRDVFLGEDHPPYKITEIAA